MKKIIVFSILMICFSFKGICQHKGSLTKTKFKVGKCNVDYLKVYYNIGSFFGEPTVKGAIEWVGRDDTDPSCLDQDTTLWIKLEDGGLYGWVKIWSDYTPKSGQGVGNDMARSPDWDEFICGWGSHQKNCLPPEKARYLYKNGRVTGFQITM